jgi:O-antigen/teichoic acid export membrane protein
MRVSGIRQLAGQTLWYGLPTIASRFLGYLMNMALPFFVELPGDTADLVQVYTLIPFLNILFAYGMETAYFRFSQNTDREKLYHTLSISLLTSTVLFSGFLWIFKTPLIEATDLDRHPQYITWMIAIIAVDNLNTLPFARLRQENRPKKYALARISGILINVMMVFFFLAMLPEMASDHPDRWYAKLFDPQMGVGYYLVGNLAGSLFTLLMLSGEFKKLKFEFDFILWKKVMRYSAPLILVGLGGMVNDVMSRLIYRHVVDLPQQAADHELGVFANIFRLALLVTIMIQAFRMAAEPFFFNQSKQDDAPKTYARVMKFFVIACCFLFLGIGLFLDLFKWIFTTFANASWAEGLEVVPLLALGNIFLGIYYNLSIWYKLTNKNHIGAYITIVGALITFLLNYWLIPVWHYAGAALATFSCYLFMMVASYRLGKKYYPVPYAVKKLSAYILLVLLIYGMHRGLLALLPENIFISMTTGLVLFVLFTRFVLRIEKRELMQFAFSRWLYKR